MSGRRDSRGFRVYCELRHNYGGLVTVKQSSSAEGERCWIFIDNRGTQLISSPNGSAHLTRAQAKRVMLALQKFLEETGP